MKNIRYQQQSILSFCFTNRLNLFWLAFLSFFLLHSLTYGAELKDAKRVLILFPGQSDLPGYPKVIKGIKSSLEADTEYRIDYFIEYMDLYRNPKLDAHQYIIDLNDYKFSGKKVDLIIAYSAPSLSLVVAQGHDLFPRTPVVFTGILREQIKGLNLSPIVTGVLADVDYAGLLETALKIHPQTRHVAIVNGASKTDLLFEKEFREALDPFAKRLDFIYLTRLPFGQILESVRDLPGNTVILFYLLTRDGEGKSFPPWQAASIVAKAANAPVYGCLDSYIGHGIVGGRMTSMEMTGVKAGELAMRIMRGENPSDIPVSSQGTTIDLFDWRQLKRWDIAEHSLPEGSIVIHRQESFFEKYKWLVIGVTVFLAVQSYLVGFLIVLNRKQRKLSANLMVAEDRYRRLLRVERASRLGELSASLAHEINQPLSAALSSTQAALRFLRANPINIERLRDILQNVAQDNKRAAGVIRSMRTMLKRGPVEKVPIVINGILKDVLAVFQGEALARGIHIEKHFESALPPVMANKSQLQQVVLNLIMNAADAVSENTTENKKIFIKSSVNDGKVQVTVRDTGAGIDPAIIEKVFEPLFTTKIGGMGMGLVLCRSIIEEHGGHIRVDKNATAGVAVTFELPAVKNE
ncbi:MAG: ABC transporter substrate binding protein [Desulfobacterales bacterium]|jgi:signal transduction histidine kinase